MKKTIAVIVALALCLCLGAAYAADGISIRITPLDPQTGQPAAPVYADNTLFALRVDISIPRFYQTDNLELKIIVRGAEIYEQDLRLENGSYYINGIVLHQPASLTVRVKDTAYENAVTAEELYNAMQTDRSTEAAYTFNRTNNSGAKLRQNVIVDAIPKTGDPSVAVTALLALIGAAVCRKGRR